MSESIADIRARIDAFDSGLLRLLAERMRVVEQLKPLKKGDVEDATRENEVRERWVNEATKLGLSPEFATAMLAIIFAESKRVQRS
ncbi:MAG TPA: chorismate mutase [Candidatus Peribacteria bacterium]|nr:chorismate mutase [Candidatus Peribacteria bacterium]